MARSTNKTIKSQGYVSTDEYYGKNQRKIDRKAFRKTTRNILSNDVVSAVNNIDQIKPSKPERHVCCIGCKRICDRKYKEFDLSYEMDAIKQVDEEISLKKQEIKNQIKEEKFHSICNSRSNQKKKKMIKKIERNGGLKELSYQSIESILNDKKKLTIQDDDIEYCEDSTDSETESNMEKLKKQKLKKDFYFNRYSDKEIERFEREKSLQVFKFYREMKNK